VEELLSIFPKDEERKAAEGVLRELVAARLLTAYEDSVEIIHESLLTAWPRLIRWQNEDEGGSLLRDQLRQAAQSWQDRGRPDDLLWTDRSYRELALWRERYTGGLTKTEDEFVQSAAKLAGRKRRRRGIAVVALVTAALAFGITTTSLWREARGEALRAEASKLLALGEVEIESNPTAALAYGIKSLELADTDEARRLSLRALQDAPTATLFPTEREGLDSMSLAFSPDGEWLAVAGWRTAQLLKREGREPVVLSGEYPSAGLDSVSLDFSHRGDVLITDLAGDVRLWAAPDGREVQRKRVFEQGGSSIFSRGDGFFTVTQANERNLYRWWPLDEGESRLIGSTDSLGSADLDSFGKRLAHPDDHRVIVRSLEDWSLPPRLLEHAAEVRGIAFHPDGELLAASDEAGEIRIWPLAGNSDRPLRIFSDEGVNRLRYSSRGRWLAAFHRDENGRPFLRIWDMSAPPGAGPLVLRNDRASLNGAAFDLNDEWVVTTEYERTAFWPLAGNYPRVFEGHEDVVTAVAFTPDGETLLSVAWDNTLRAWPIRGDGAERNRVLLRIPMLQSVLDVDSTGKHAVVSGTKGRVVVVPLAGGPARELFGFSDRVLIGAVRFSPDGMRVAAGPNMGPAEEKVIRIWELDSDEVRVLGPVPDAGEGTVGGFWDFEFLDDDRI
ncbi:MAG: WD40 repeat domain-containing protein, partial [Vicinamibacteria bacterium]